MRSGGTRMNGEGMTTVVIRKRVCLACPNESIPWRDDSAVLASVSDHAVRLAYRRRALVNSSIRSPRPVGTSK